MDKKHLSLDIENFEIIPEEYSDNQLAIVEIYVCHDGNNRHNVPISHKALVNAKDTLKNKFLVAGFDGNDFEGHEKDEIIIGFFPESSKMKFVKKKGRTYLVAQAIMSKVYARWAYDIFANNGNHRDVSMEITVLDGETDEYGDLVTIDKFVFNGVTVLGLSHVPACEGSSASIIKFDTENALRIYNEHYSKTTNLKKKYVDDMVKFSVGKEDIKLDKEEKVVEEEKTVECSEEETVEKESTEKEKVDCETQDEDKKDEVIYSDSSEESDENDDSEDENSDDDTKEVEHEIKDSKEEECEDDSNKESLPTENCETDENDEGEKKESFEEVIAERDSLKKENESLLAKVEKYEAEEKAIKVETIISNVSKVFSADELSELREESKNYSLEELNVFDNLVKAKAFDRVGEVKTEKKFTKVAINDMLDKPESKYLW